MASTSEAGKRSLHVPKSGESDQMEEGKTGKSSGFSAFWKTSQNIGFSASSGSCVDMPPITRICKKGTCRWNASNGRSIEEPVDVRAEIEHSKAPPQPMNTGQNTHITHLTVMSPPPLASMLPSGL